MATDSVVPLPPKRPPWLASIEPTPATEIIKSAGRLKVDGHDLKVIGQYLGELATASRSIQSGAATAASAATLTGGRYRSLGSDNITHVTDMRADFGTATQRLDTHLGNLAKALDKTADAMVRIAKAYKDADERNKLDAETVRRYLGR